MTLRQHVTMLVCVLVVALAGNLLAARVAFDLHRAELALPRVVMVKVRVVKDQARHPAFVVSVPE